MNNFEKEMLENFKKDLDDLSTIRLVSQFSENLSIRLIDEFSENLSMDFFKKSIELNSIREEIRELRLREEKLREEMQKSKDYQPYIGW